MTGCDDIETDQVLVAVGRQVNHFFQRCEGAFDPTCALHALGIFDEVLLGFGQESLGGVQLRQL